LRGQTGSLPAPRKFTRDQLHDWIAADEADMRRLDNRDDEAK